MDLFHQPIPDLPGVPPALTEVLRYGMANEPAARPTAEQMREMLSSLHLPNTNPVPPPTIYRSSTFVPPSRPSPPSPPRLVPPVTPTTSPDDTPTVSTDGKRAKKKWMFGGG
jgi:hypothetical protein